ncbi:MAG TPA: hypothetical protein VMG35_15460 [Bryobacteraceae bacterium]|nr:hypothetical protein [Bryobacteraceae bacterium]
MDTTGAQFGKKYAGIKIWHIRHVIELYRSHVFYPEMGPYQGYYRINP